MKTKKLDQILLNGNNVAMLIPGGEGPGGGAADNDGNAADGAPAQEEEE
jgi:hypothetical protein